MLFNSPEFIYFFLPFTIVIWWLLHRLDKSDYAQWFVIYASLFFYGWWDVRYVPLLVVNALINFYLGQMINHYLSRSLLILGLVWDIGLLAYFKYADFFIENWGAVTGNKFSLIDVILPLGISFFTFQAIAYLVDCYKGLVVDFNLRRFAFSITFYPHLIAGPILHYSDVMPQLREKALFNAKLFSQGLFLFAIGLFKKTVIADRIAEVVDPLFTTDTALQLFESWTAALGYGLQIYFDFSGYSDMAIGIGYMFGIALPLNFNSPYKATNIAEFWKRWHMTLSRFLRDYVYFPLGGNRSGFARGLFAAFLTMFIGGLWHGAAWTFVLWGMMHGFFIGIHRLWYRYITRKCGCFNMAIINTFDVDMVVQVIPKRIAVAITFVSVTFAWVMFRASSINQALSVWKGMVGLNGMAYPAFLRSICKLCAQTSQITCKTACKNGQGIRENSVENCPP
jgi:D-alanyl-lipoteichoic acid acyltransferase DltB (MBOAT superfamily)